MAEMNIRRPRWQHALLWSLLIVPFALIGWERCGVRGCPSVERLAAYQPGGAPVLLDRSGEPFATLVPVEREIMALDSLPAHVRDAFIAVEDRRFYEHGGIDARRVVGALLADVRAGAFVQGSSTITMQVARNVFPDRLPGSQKTLRRKLLEVRVAREIEDRFEKDEILELYLNHIYFGAGVYGIAAASRHYFGHAAPRLTLPQAALLAALPRAPNYYDPRRNPDAARSRRSLVLSLMEEQDRITADEAVAARAAGLGITATTPRRRDESVFAPYFVEAVRRVVEDRLGDALYSAPLLIHTTLDRTAQRAAETQLERQLVAIERGTYGRFNGPRYASAADPPEAPAYVQGAVIVMQVEDGDVLALVGGRDFRHSRFDRALRARRQVGSAFKPFVFAAALADGYAPSQHVADTPLRLELAGGEIWEPRNLTGGFEGEITLRDALVRSKNVPAVRLAGSVGLRRVARVARRSGIDSDIPALPSMALGTAAMSPFELTAAYAAFANGGHAVQPRLVSRIEDPAGKTVWEPRVRKRRALSGGVAFLVTDMLRDAVDHGTGRAVRRAGFAGPAAGKTGTTDGGRDAWFVGYTPDLVAGIWIGFDRPRPIADDAVASRIASPAWGRLMQQIYRERPLPPDWEPPARLVQRSIDPASGLVLADGCRPRTGRAVDEYFLPGTEPARTCPVGDDRAGGPGVLARAGAFARHLWHVAESWVLARLGRDDEDEPSLAERERMLGSPRLPRRAEIRQPEIDSTRYPRLLGRPWVPPIEAPDSIIIVPDTIVPPRLPDTLPPVRDTVPPARDTLPPARDTLPPARDTLRSPADRARPFRDTRRQPFR
jgi:penicillin-binding protein 1A